MVCIQQVENYTVFYQFNTLSLLMCWHDMMLNPEHHVLNSGSESGVTVAYFRINHMGCIQINCNKLC